MPLLPIDAKQRKQVPVYSGFMAYFPDAIAAVAQHSYDSNEQHNPGQPLQWDRSKSTDETDALARHLLELADGEGDIYEQIELAKAVAWRSMANLQKLIETRRYALDNAIFDAFWDEEPEVTNKYAEVNRNLAGIDDEEWAAMIRAENSATLARTESARCDKHDECRGFTDGCQIETSKSQKLARDVVPLTDAERQAENRADILALARGKGSDMERILKANDEYIRRLNFDYQGDAK